MREPLLGHCIPVSGGVGHQRLRREGYNGCNVQSYMESQGSRMNLLMWPGSVLLTLGGGAVILGLAGPVEIN